MNELKAKVAKAALGYVENYKIIGVGTGSTVDYFIQELEHIKHRIDGCVASSKATEMRLRALRIPILDLNSEDVPIYIDGADEVNSHYELIKGGGGALTAEKIIAHAAQVFICIVDKTKLVSNFGTFPVAVEVLPMARSSVARALVQLGGNPCYREGFITDHGNIILDVFDLPFATHSAAYLENKINCIPGVLENGIFANRLPNLVLVSEENKVLEFRS